jgi:hypothetical protein
MGTLTFRAVLLGSLAGTVGCSKEPSQVVEKVEDVKERSTPQPLITGDDFKVFDVVLLDILHSKDFDLWPRGDDSSNKLILDPMTAGLFESGEQSQFDRETRDSIDQAERVELGNDLRKRNPEKPISLADYKSPIPKILLKNLIDPSPGEESPEEGTLNDRFRVRGLPPHSKFVIAWLPGYTKDGNTAAFKAFLGPTMHGATLTYKLAKKEGKWTVAWRHMNMYQ